jgi:hypothetical protein
LSAVRTLRNHASSKITIALAGSAVAVTAFASGGTAALLASPAAPASAASTAARPPAGKGSGGTTLAGQFAAGRARSLPTAPLVLSAGATGDVVLLSRSATHHRYAHRLARRMLRHFHWRMRRQDRYLNRLWERESGWNHYAYNPYSGAYGIPQADPGAKMATAGPHWRRSCRTQIRWGLRYIRARYGSPHRAWEHEAADGWY